GRSKAEAAWTPAARSVREDRSREVLQAGRGGEDPQGQRQDQVRRDGRGGDEPGGRSAPRRSGGARRDLAAERHRKDAPGRGVRQGRQGRGGEGRRSRY